MHGQLEIAEVIARRVHATQLDKIGDLYIGHPIRVSENAAKLASEAGLSPSETETTLVAAWLHDVIEDSLDATGVQVTAEDLRAEGISESAIEVVLLLTKPAGENRDLDAYYRAIAAHPLARLVKLADIADNTQLWRLERLSPEIQARLRSKYGHALEVLGV